MYALPRELGTLSCMMPMAALHPDVHLSIYECCCAGTSVLHLVGHLLGGHVLDCGADLNALQNVKNTNRKGWFCRSFQGRSRLGGHLLGGHLLDGGAVADDAPVPQHRHLPYDAAEAAKPHIRWRHVLRKEQNQCLNRRTL